MQITDWKHFGFECCPKNRKFRNNLKHFFNGQILVAVSSKANGINFRIENSFIRIIVIINRQPQRVILQLFFLG